MDRQLESDTLDIAGPVYRPRIFIETVKEDELLTFGESGKFAHDEYQGFG